MLLGVVLFTLIFFGIVGMRTPRAQDTFKRIDETQLESLVLRLCFIFCHPRSFFFSNLVNVRSHFSCFARGTFSRLSA